jgi:hypothetical protein
VEADDTISMIIRIAITAAAFEAIKATLPLSSVGYEAEPNAKAERLIWLEAATVRRLGVMRGPGESYSELAELESKIGANQ